MINPNIKFKIWLVIGILLISIVINSIASQYVARKNAVRLLNVSDVLIPASHKSQEMLSSFKTQLRHYQDSVVFGDLGLLTEAAGLQLIIEQQLDSLMTDQIIMENNKALLEDIYDEYVQFCVASQYVYGMLAKADKESVEKAQELTPELDERKDLLLARFTDFSGRMSKQLRNEIAAVNDDTRNVNTTLMLFSAIVVLVALTVNYFIVKFKIIRSIDSVFERLAVAEKDKELTSQLYERHRLESLGELAGGVAHEINTPIACVYNNLSIMDNYANMLSDIIALAEEMLAADSDQLPPLLGKMQFLDERENFEFVMNDIGRMISESSESIQRVSSIVSNMTLFARPDAIDSVRYNVVDGVKSALKIVHGEMISKCKLYEDYQVVPEIIAFPGEINLVFLSLLQNAIQAILDDGTIWVRVWDKEGLIYVQIKDDGCGMSDEDMKYIFDPFYSTRPVGKGLGLGLSVANSIITKHGGTIEVASGVGMGATFTVVLPVISKISRQFSMKSAEVREEVENA